MKYCRVYSVGNDVYGIGFEHKGTTHPLCPKGYKHYFMSDMTKKFDTEEQLNDFLRKHPEYEIKVDDNE